MGVPLRFNGSVVAKMQDRIKIRAAVSERKFLSLISLSTAQKDEYVSHRARGSYIASVCRPDLMHGFPVAAQHLNPSTESAKYLNKVIRKCIESSSIGVDFVTLDMSTISVGVFIDASFANNSDYSSQLGFLTTLMDATNTCNIVHYGSVKCKRVTRSALASELYAMVYGIDQFYVIQKTIKLFFGKRVPLRIFTDSLSLFDSLTHKGSSDTEPVIRKASGRCQNSIANAAALVVIQDLRPLSFTENKPGMASLLESVFVAGQTVPAGVRVNPKSYIPSRTAIGNSVCKQAESLRRAFAILLRDKILSWVDAVSGDHVVLKVQCRPLYDFTLHHIKVIKPRNLTESSTFRIRRKTLLLVEGPDSPTAAKMRGILDENLQATYEISLEKIQEKYILVTDGAAVISKMAGSSVSTNVCAPDEKWLRCYVQMLNNAMKAAMAQCKNHEILNKVVEVFRAVKRAIEDSNCGQWEKKPPEGHRLVQDVEIRFGINYLVDERFIKPSSLILSLIATKHRNTALQAFNSIPQQQSNVLPLSTDFPTIEAIVDSFKCVYEATVMFQDTDLPTIIMALPNLYHCLSGPRRLENGGNVFRDDEIELRPSVYTMALC